jgi:site-specific DNA-methyltransferase (adenine-specific)
MDKFKGMMTSLSPHWATPKGLYDQLNTEFYFDFDPCPLHSDQDRLAMSWGESNFINPPYGKEIGKWIAKAYSEAQGGATCVLLIPSRTDTKWWHDYIMKADEIRFIRGRLHFNESKNSAPFPSCIAIFRGNK